jgi:carboxyl-terminal processing protease
MRTPKRRAALATLAWAAALAALGQAGAAPRPLVLAEIDKIIREGFYDAKLKGVDWNAAVAAASAELVKASTPAEQNDVYDRLLAKLSDSHTFRIPPGRLPERGWATTGLRIGQDGDGYAVKGVIPGSAADRAGMKLGDRILEMDGVRYGSERVNFRDLVFVSEGAPGSVATVAWRRADGPPRTDRLIRTAEEPGDALAWKSARVIRKDGRNYGYAHLWGMSAETALAVVDLLLDRKQTARARTGLDGWGEIDGFLLDVRGNSGGYDPNILSTFLQGQWSAGDYYTRTREGRRLEPPVYARLPVALLVDSGTASSAEALALKFRAHRIGPIVGEPTAGMMSGGAAAERLSDGSMLWYTARAIEGLDGKSYEGAGVVPDVVAADRPAPAEAGEDRVVEAAIRALGSAAVSSR